MASSHRRPTFYKRKRYFGSYRIWLYGYNVVLIVVLIIFVSVTAKILRHDRMYLFPLEHSEPLVLYVFCGPFLQLVDIFTGFLGIWRQRTSLLTFYWWLLLSILLCDLIIGILWIFRWRSLHSTSGAYFLNLLASESDSPTFCRLWNDVQTEFSCCGVYSIIDWQRVGNFCQEHLANGSRLPRSCCDHADNRLISLCHDDADDPLVSTSPASTSYQPKGCRDALIKWLYRQSNVVFLLGICVVVFLKVVGLVIMRTEIRQLGDEIFARENRNAILAQSRFSVDMSPFNNPGTYRRHAVELSPLSALAIANGNCRDKRRKKDTIRLVISDSNAADNEET